MSTMDRKNIQAVVRSLRRVNLQGSLFGQTVAIRFGLSESDIETLEALIDMGASTAGRLSDVTGLTSGAVTRVIDRLEQSGYVRRIPDPADRRRVIVEVVPEKVASIEAALDRIGAAGADEIGRYTDAQVALITDFLTKMEHITRQEAESLREHAATGEDAQASSEHAAPVGGLTEARLLVRSGLSELILRGGAPTPDLYRAQFSGATPQVRLRDGRVIIQYRGIPFDWRKRKATVALNGTIPWSFEIVGGIQRVQADLRAVDTRGLRLTGGTERVQLELGRPNDEVKVEVIGGARTIRIERPRETAVRLHVMGGAAGIELDGQVVGAAGGATTLQSAGWTGRGGRYLVEVVGGSHTIEILGR
jgi:DNA-binding MarR family transcriptional regulator